MSDDPQELNRSDRSLRSRIAAVLAAHQRDEGEPSGYCECGEMVFYDEMNAHQADAVIAELQKQPCEGPHKCRCGHCRWKNEWKADDE